MSINKKADKILNTTIHLFLRNGVKKITMDDIAENSKVSKVTIYKYFADKDTLYFEISKHIFSNYIKQLQSTIASDEVLVKKLYAFLEIISDFTNSGQFALCRELAKFNHTIETESEMYLETYKHSLLTLIDEGIKTGLIKGNLDREKIFFYIDMGVVYYQQNCEYRNKMLCDKNFQQQFMLFFINNIFTDGAQILSVI